MSSRNYIKILGATLFLTGFIIFLTVFFLARYKLTRDSLEEHVYEEEQSTLLKNAMSEVIGRTYPSSIGFVRDLSAGLQAANDRQIEKYAINEFEINQMVAHTRDNRFDIDVLENILDPGNPVHQFKIQTFRDYGSWLDGRVYENKTLLENDINSVAENIRKYGIINKKGFDRYRSKDLKYALAKASSFGPVSDNQELFLLLTFGLCIVGGLVYFSPGIKEIPGIKNNGIFFNAMTNGGWMGILTGTFLIIYYILLTIFLSI